MTIKIGKYIQEKVLDETDNLVKKDIGTIIEKTQGTYIEILICKESNETLINDEILNSEYRNDFDVYVGKTVDQVLRLNGITDYTWTQALTEVSQ